MHENNMLIIKLFKLLLALFFYTGNYEYQAEMDRIKAANERLKDEGKQVLNNSQAVSIALKSKNIDKIESVLENWNKCLSDVNIRITLEINRESNTAMSAPELIR